MCYVVVRNRWAKLFLEFLRRLVSERIHAVCLRMVKYFELPVKFSAHAFQIEVIFCQISVPKNTLRKLYIKLWMELWNYGTVPCVCKVTFVLYLYSLCT
jgi:hypothetical protein